jgi:4-amino-4-deoxy-L-arabinose transferase-like glycosyltransferase
MGRRRLLDWFRPSVVVAFAVVALPWYVLCFFRNGWPFLEKFFWQHQVGRFTTTALAHGQPFWFFVPVLVAGLFPWIPGLALLTGGTLYSDSRRRFLLLWALFAFIFFSAAQNKLPSYVLPVVPPLAALMGIALAARKHVRWLLVATTAFLVFLGPIAAMLPEALAAGISRSTLPAFQWMWLLPALACAAVWVLDAAVNRGAAVALLTAAVAAGAVAIELRAFPEVDRVASARPLWNAVAPIRERVCIAQLHRSLRYGLNYYSVTPLPDCHQEPREVEITQEPGAPPHLVSAIAVPASGY